MKHLNAAVAGPACLAQRELLPRRAAGWLAILACALCCAACAAEPAKAPDSTGGGYGAAPPGDANGAYPQGAPPPLATAPSGPGSGVGSGVSGAPSMESAGKLPAPAPSVPSGPPPGSLARGDGAPADEALALGDAAYLADRLAEAQTHFTKARRLAPKDPAPRVGLLRVALAKTGVATDYAIAPKNAKVRALVREADAILKLDPAFGPTHVEKGRLLLILGQAEPALASLQRGVELSPGDPEAHSALGVARLALGKTEEALRAFERAVELDGRSSDRLTNLGTAYMLRGKVDEAIKAYERALTLAPNDPRAHGDLGTAYLAANRAKDALRELKRAVAIEPRATFLSNLGYAYQLSGDLKLAVETYRKALKADPKLGSAWINLGTALAKQGELLEAERAFKRAEQLDPSDPRVKANLAELAELKAKRAAP